MNRRKSSGTKPIPNRSIPRWLVVAGTIATILVGYIGARGGPIHTWKEIREVFGFVIPPRIISLQPMPSEKTTFVVAIQNPSLRRTEVTAVEVEPTDQLAAYTESPMGAGRLPVIKADQARPPADCNTGHRIELVTPLVIEPESSGGIQITPWQQECDFVIKVIATSGTSEEAVWAPKMDALLKRLEREAPELYDQFKAPRTQNR